MGLVVGLSSYLQARRNGPPGQRLNGGFSCGLTRRDREALEAWSTSGRRAVISTTETGTFAMLYEGQCWASCAVQRKPHGILLWDCVTHADIGRFPTMADALAAGGGRRASVNQGPVEQVPVDNVYPIRGRAVRCA